MAIMKITLNSMINYQNDLFDALKLPDLIDKAALISNIIMRAGEFEVVYANPIFLKNAIEVWSVKNQRTFDKWVEALSADFSPIENYDRYENYKDKTESAGKTDYGLSNTVEDKTATTTTGGLENENKTSAYDSTTYQPKDQQNTTYNNLKNQNSGTRTSTNNGSDSSSGTTDFSHEAHIHGNIGVTESTTMAEHYIDFYKNFNLYELITDLFINEFTLPIY